MKKLSTLLIVAFIFSLHAAGIPKLSSYPAAVSTIFLDFDGHTVTSAVWNSGNRLVCAASGMTDAQITEAFNRVAEDYRPFNINITTDSTVFLAAPLTKRVRIIVTATSDWYPGVGGVSYIGSFNWGDDTPGFVFSAALGYSPKMVGECCSHESGHTVGLSHQSKYSGTDCSTPIEEYNSGYGYGETGWAPIMGNSYYENMSSWNNGPTPYGCSNVQDNLSIITSQNGFTYRTDDYAETLNASTTALAANSFTVGGIITTNTDKDAFKFTLTQNSNLHLTAIPFNVGGNYIGANLDIRLTLFNSAATAIRTYDPAETMSVTVDTLLNAGTYYLRVDGGGTITPYGSLGSYTISGTTGALPIHEVALSGTAEKNKHNLSWKIVADEAIKTVEIQSSTDGINFKALTTVDPAVTKSSFQPLQSGTIYYRLKVTSILYQTVYSNVVALKAGEGIANAFTVSTLVKDDILIGATENYQYRLLDLNGRLVARGNGTQGSNRVNITNQASGMYVLQLLGNTKQETERIVKQ